MKQYLIDITALADRVLGWGLLGALCGYLVLFGPLVSIPLVLGAQGASALTAGLVLTALPARFAFADIGAGAILPTWLSERRRATLGAVICTGGLGAMLLTPLFPALCFPCSPSSASVWVSSPPPTHHDHGSHASLSLGGLLNLACGLGPALGVGAVTLALNLGAGLTRPYSGDRLAVLTLLVTGVIATLCSHLAGRNDPDGDP